MYAGLCTEESDQREFEMELANIYPDTVKQLECDEQVAKKFDLSAEAGLELTSESISI